MLCAGGAGVIGKDAHRRTNWKFRRLELRTGARGENAVFLIGIDHDQIRDRLSGEIAHKALALIDGETRGPAITRHRHPAGVNDDPALVALMSDHCRKHRQSDILEAADTDPGHHQIEEHEDASAHLGDPGKATLSASAAATMRERSCSAIASKDAGLSRP